MNVFVILADSFRFDHLGCCGNDWIRTPALDAFAREATLFEQCYSENMPTLPNRQALFTGRFGLPFRGWQALDMQHVLAEWVWDRGLRTCLVSDTYHMHKPGMLYCRGFDDVSWVRGQEWDPIPGDPSTDTDVDRYFKGDGSPGSDEQRALNDRYLRGRSHWRSDEDCFVAQCVKQALAWLDRQQAAGRRDGLFLWLDSFDPHEPWDPMPPFDTMYGPLLPGGRQLIAPIPRPVDGYLTDEECAHVQQQYAGLCSAVDKWVGIFLQELRERGYFDNSLVVFTTDHGEPLGHGKWGHGLMRKCRPWPYEELAHIPLIVRHPQFGHGRRLRGFAQPQDVTATLLDFLGVEPLPGMHGQSLLPAMQGDEDALRPFAVSGFHRASWSLRTADSTLILWQPELGTSHIPAHSVGAPQGDQRPRPPELYLRRSDPYELDDVGGKHPEEVSRLEAGLRGFVDDLVWE
jgi:arylsulfatase A-like enzyme